MSKFTFHWILVLTAALVFAVVGLASDQPAVSEELPAILTSLDPAQVTVLDDQSAMAVRGQDFAYQYVLVKILGINALDWGPGVNWTWNPLGYRYGAFGGPGYSNPGQDPADAMDALFEVHDKAYSEPNANLLQADLTLLAELKKLPNTDSWWGPIYVASPTGLNADKVYVSAVSFFGNKLFFGWKAMPYTEYARRQAMAAMGVLVFGRSLTSFIKLQ